MECKNVQKHVSLDLAKHAEHEKSTNFCSRWGQVLIYGIIVCFIATLLMSNIYLHSKYLSLTKELKDQRKLLQRLTSKASSENHVLPTSPGYRIVQKRNLQPQHRRRHRRNRRERMGWIDHTLRFLINLPAKHLRGFSQQGSLANTIFDHETSISNPIFSDGCSNGCFLWPDASVDDNDRFQYERKSAGSSNGAIVGIRILYPGKYMIYSQVLLKGPDVRAADSPSVGYETAVVPQGGNEIEVLQTSYITQDDRGRVYSNSYPMDSFNHFGVFDLRCGDVVFLRPTTNSYNANFVIVEERSYFGLYLVVPFNNNIDGSSYEGVC